jgi:hypothetical protein
VRVGGRRPVIPALTGRLSDGEVAALIASAYVHTRYPVGLHAVVKRLPLNSDRAFS